MIAEKAKLLATNLGDLKAHLEAEIGDTFNPRSVSNLIDAVILLIDYLKTLHGDVK